MPATLQPRVIYGLKTDIISNAHFITDTEILYPVGNVLAVHNISQNQQKLIRLSEKQQVNIMCVSPNKRLVAISEVGEKPLISIYDIQTLKKRKTLGIPYDPTDVTNFSCMSFTFDSKYLSAVTGKPDQTMLYYNWEKGKLESSFKASNPQNPTATVDTLACNPADGGVVALGGSYIFKCLTLSETVWRSYGFNKADNIPICTMAWLNADRLLLGTKDGRILYLENGDLKNVYRMSDTVSLNLKIKEEYVIHASNTMDPLEDKEEEWEDSICCLTAFARGFAYGHGKGTIIVFEKSGQHKYTKRNTYVIPSQVIVANNRDLYRINTINVNLSYDRLIVTTGWSQLFYAILWGPDSNAQSVPRELEIIGQHLHYGPIRGLSMCAWKPIFMTYGEIDHTVRLWDFEYEKLILLKQYTEDIYSIALHPTGLFCLIGFNDKLRFMTILIDDLLPMEEFHIRYCRTVAFSYGGHLFAAVNGNVVQVYTTVGYYNRFILKGHTGKVKALVWSQTDTKLITLGAEGSIYQWNMSTGERTDEMILKGMNLQDIALASDESFIYCIADDNCVREIKENVVSREFHLSGIQMQSMLLGKEDQILFFACQRGVILSMKCPLQEPIEFLEFHIHCVDVSKISVSYNEECLVSTGIDGSLCIWKIFYPQGKIGKEVTYTNEILISKTDLEEKIQMTKELVIRINELETENSYKLRQIDVSHNEKVREIHQGYCEAIEELKNRIDQLQEQYTAELNSMNTEIVKMTSAHKESMKDMESDYEAKLITEYDKYKDLENYMSVLRQDYEKQLRDLEIKKDEERTKVTLQYEAQIHEKNLELQETREEVSHRTQLHDELTAEIEEDADREILEIRTNFETLLHEEREQNLKLKGEAGVMRNKYIASQKDIEELKRQLQNLQGEYSYFQKNIQNLEKHVTDVKKEISERDVTIQEKEQHIYDLKRTNQELEKFKFVLNYKITELKEQIQPRDLSIKELKEKIRDMEVELVNLHKTNVSLELQLHELREKLGATRRELQVEVYQRNKCQQLLKRIRIDILDASGLVQEPHALKLVVKNLYHKYSAADEFLRSRKADMTAYCEFKKQKEHLERTIASLKKQVLPDGSVKDRETDKIIGDNVTLIAGMNALREELKDARKHILHMEGLLGVKDAEPSEAKKKLEKACHAHDDLKREYRLEIQKCQHVITALKDDVNRLLVKLSSQDMEKTRASI